MLSITSYADCAKEYIVMLKNDAVIKSRTSAVLEPVSEEWNIYTVSEEDLNMLDMSYVECIDEDVTVELLDFIPDDPKYNLQRDYADIIKLPYAWENGFFGENIKVGIIDSGINKDHPDLNDNIERAVDVINLGDASEDVLHGSSVAGIIGAEINNGIGVSGVSKADIYMYKVFQNSTTSVSNIIKGFSEAVNVDGCQVVNMSIGIANGSGDTLSNKLQILNTAIENATKEGVIVVAAAGNSADKGNPMLYPAGFENVISVGAIDKEEKYTYFSQYNEMVDVAAPGYMVYTTSGSNYGYVNGTSFASPYVAGAAAIVKGINPEIDHKTFETLIKLSSKDVGSIGRDVHYGWGILDIKKLVRLAEDTVNNTYLNSFEYDGESNLFWASYYNSGTLNEVNKSIRLAVYDKNGLLIYLSPSVDVDVNQNTEKVFSFEDIDIPDGGCGKLFTLKKEEFMTPVMDVLTIYN